MKKYNLIEELHNIKDETLEHILSIKTKEDLRSEKMKEQEEKKSFKWIGVTAALACALVVAVIFVNSNMSDKTNKTSEKSNNSVTLSNAALDSNSNSNNEGVSNETLDNLKDIIGAKDNNVVVEYILINNVTKVDGGLVTNLDNLNKEMLILNYAKGNNMLTEVSTKKAYDDGTATECPAILKTDFDNIVKKYGITEKFSELDFVEEGNYYVYISGAGFNSVSYTQSNFKVTYNGEDLILTADCAASGEGSAYDSNATTTSNYSLTYTFKLNSENNYYLYSVSKK